MKEQLKQQVVIMATLLGLSDEEINSGIIQCESALIRHGLVKKAGNPHIKTLAKKVEVSLIDELLETTKLLNVTSPTTVKFIYSMIAEVNDDLVKRMSKWQCARLLTELSETSDLVVKAKDRGQNVFTFVKIGEPKEQIRQSLVDEEKPAPTSNSEEILQTLNYIEVSEIEQANLRLQQADYYLKDIREKGQESVYWAGKEDIEKIRAAALSILKNHE